MNIIDIIVALLLFYGIWQGWKNGILVQLSGITGVVLGAWLAYLFSQRVSLWLGIEPDYKTLVFVAILIAVMIGVIITSHLLTKLLTYGGLSFPIKLLGAAVSCLKMVLILSLALRVFALVNQHDKITNQNYVTSSICYAPLEQVSDLIYPYISRMFDTVSSQTLNQQDALKQELEATIKEQVRQQVKQQIEDQIKSNNQNE